jgi:transcriptional regulator of arginine metabolism
MVKPIERGEAMKQRYGRLTAIKDLIKKNKIDNQDTLLNLLKEEGFDVTQATLSRDLKALKVGKISDGWSGYYYSLPENDLVAESEKSYIQDVRRGVVSIEFSGNVGVVKTRSGHANSVALALETLSLPEILGTLAGDDTVIIVLREGVTKEDLLESFKSRIPELED